MNVHSSSLIIKTLHQDVYFKPNKPRDVDTGYMNWEVPESVHFERLESDMKKFLEQDVNDLKDCRQRDQYPSYFAQLAPKNQVVPDTSHTSVIKILIVEGFLLFTYKPIVELCDIRIFIHVDEQTCKLRRLTTKPVPVDYFDKLVWPAYLEHNSELVNKRENIYGSNSVYHVNGIDDPKLVLEQAAQHCGEWFKHNSVDLTPKKSYWNRMTLM
jgi:uridine kinase